ncbi:MAG: hypothetical protein AAFR61_02375 [Bacteroidota bacterium]
MSFTPDTSILRTSLLLLASLLLISSQGACEQEGPPPGPIFLADSLMILPTDIQLGTDTFWVYREGRPNGAMISWAKKTEDTLFIGQHLAFAQANIAEHAQSALSYPALLPMRHRVWGQSGDTPLEAELIWQDSLIFGHIGYPLASSVFGQDLLVRDTILFPGWERLVWARLLPAMRLAPEQVYHQVAFCTEIGHLSPLSLWRQDSIAFQRDGDTLWTYTVDMRGDFPDQRVYISQETPARILKIEGLESPWEFINQLNSRIGPETRPGAD